MSSFPPLLIYHLSITNREITTATKQIGPSRRLKLMNFYRSHLLLSLMISSALHRNKNQFQTEMEKLNHVLSSMYSIKREISMPGPRKMVKDILLSPLFSSLNSEVSMFTLLHLNDDFDDDLLFDCFVKIYY